MNSSEARLRVKRIAHGSWNYRVMKRGDLFAVFSAYYDDAGNLEGFSADAISEYAESLDELSVRIESIRLALSKPILIYQETVEDTAPVPDKLIRG